MKAQVSIEYLIVLGLAAIILIAAVSIFPQQLQDANNQEIQAQAQLKELQELANAASTSITNYRATMPNQVTLATTPVTLEVEEDPENYALIRNTRTNEVIAVTQLPTISEVEDVPPGQPRLINVIKQNDEIIIQLP